MSKRILILGGHGFIGSHTANILRNQGHTIGVVDCYHRYYTFPQEEYECVLKQRQDHCGADSVYPGQIEDAVFMENTFKSFQPNIVIHVATYPNAYMVKRNVIDATSNMVTATAVTLDLCVEHNVERVVFASSSMVYGDFTSEAPVETSRTNPLTLYGSYKLQGEKMCQIWNREKGLEYSILRPSALYGTRDMIVRVISKLAEAAMTSGELRVQGPDNKLDFSWVTDVASAFATAATHPACANEIFNCTRGKGRTILEAAEMVQARLGGKIVTLPHDDFYPNRDTLTSDKLKNMTGWNPQMDIDQGIPLYLNWLLEQPYITKQVG
ncbi:MAG: hypothetical protein CMF52_00295 [Legionellales bacterium]|nr:hypothetical protein [Legionellales bacterium]